MRGHNPHDRPNLQVDLLEILLEYGAIRPESVPVTVVVALVRRARTGPHPGNRRGTDRRPRAPVDYVSPAETEIWLLDDRATREYLADLREHPPWFDADD